MGCGRVEEEDQSFFLGRMDNGSHGWHQFVKVKPCDWVLLCERPSERTLRIDMESCTQVAHVRLAPGVIPGPTSGVRVSIYDTDGKGVSESKCDMCVLVTCIK